MADQQPRKLWRIVLVTSLALNLAVVGVIGGLALRSSGDKGPPRNFDVGLGSIGRALSQEDRRAIGSALRNAPGSRASGRAENEAMLDSLIVALRADPYSEAALQDALDAPRVRAATVRETAIAALKLRIAAMSQEERNGLADRLAANESRNGRKP